MKRLTFILTLMLVAEMPMMAEHVNPETACKVATTFLNYKGEKTIQLTDLSKEAGFQNLYIFNTEQGFVVMAADDCVQPILGYSTSSNLFDKKEIPENVYYWLKEYDDQIFSAIESHQTATAEISKQWNDLLTGKSLEPISNKSVDAIIQTRWDQGSPYNNLCPTNCVTGCVATAMAQIMKFWNYPSRGIGSHDYQYGTYGTISADFGATTYDWTNMIDNYANGSTQEQREAVATLMYHCGVSVEMQYGPSESGSNIQRSSFSMKTYFNYNTNFIEKKDFSEANWINTLKNELDQNRPILYAGSGSKGGHAFVCDGYDSNNNFHFNWGWGGSFDGFFSITSLTPRNYDFSNDQSAVINLYPLTDNILPLNLTLSETEETVTLNWTDSQSSSSYNLYRNNALIATTTASSYTDTYPTFGSNVYYVRGLKDNNLSLPSNCETINIDYPTPIANNLEASISDGLVSLSWNQSDWCFPSQEDDASFSYVDEERLNLDSYYFWGEGNFTLSWGHRYPAECLYPFEGKVIFDISFFTMIPGAFDVVVYQDTYEDKPAEEIARQSVSTARIGWSHVFFNNPIIIDTSKDLWLFVINTDYKVHTVYHKTISGHTNACYFSGSDPIANCSHALNNNDAWLIRAHLTDGTYSYNLYQDGVRIAENLGETTYPNASLNENTANLFTVRTKYYGGEAIDSNKIGFAKGNAPLVSLNLGENDQMTITENSTLTVSGNLSNDNPDHFILEDGAQLIHSSEGVQATVKKNITAYTQGQNNGWHLLASPMTESLMASHVTGLLANNYDLYSFNQNEEDEWRNYENQNFTIDNKKGYLYANSGNPTLSFAGTLAASVEPTDLTYSDNTEFSGFNLIGNPYPCNTYVTGRSFYVLQETDNVSEFVVGSNPIPPCSAILVQAQGTGESVTFSKTAPTKNEAIIAITVTKADTREHAVVDKAKVTFDPSHRLTKYNLKDESSKLYLPQNGQDLAVACANGESALPVNFKAAKDGTYTISFETESLELDYLHLIDNLTGNDVDLLATPYYTFEAKPTDYASRFNIVFAPICEDADGDNDVFAYVNNGEIVLVETCHGASLQIVDMTGRVIVCGDAARLVTTNGMTPGVYILRLIDGDNVKTQKIVIE